MLLDGITPESFISLLKVKLNADYTEEQSELIQSFGRKPTFCFADPGTGKTYTAVGGLVFAELYKQIPGKNIYAMSFTNMATGELAVRHKRACDALGISSTVNFSTLHKLCNGILADNYRKLNMLTFGKTQNLPFAEAYRLIEGTISEWGIKLTPNQIRACIRACRSLNSSLVFDEDNVRTKACFKECKMNYKEFEKVRGLLYTYSLSTESIDVSDIMLYTLMLLEKYPEVSQQFKAQCKMMLIDEAQDLSLLHLRIISKLTDCPVFIGDMKQQIYAFNGACQEIVEAFFKQWPNADTVKLTKSFRCKDEIAKFATNIILPNAIGGEDFKGVAPGGLVQIHCSNSVVDSGYDLPSIVSTIHDDFVTNKSKLTKDYLFLFRNNISALPIGEELFKKGIPFRVNNYTPAYEVPVIKEMCEILQLVESPHSLQYIPALRYLIPEFRSYNDLSKHPMYTICRKSGCDVLSVNYPFQNPDIGDAAMNLLVNLREMMLKGSTVGELFNTMWTMYDEVWVKPNEWRLEASKEYYLNNVNILTRKPYTKFIQDEVQKVAIIKESMRYERGVRCYTMHASKGLEADVVYIIDADDGVMPNVKKIDDMLKKGSEMDAARTLREERSLAYVACTRAKEELHIVYNTRLSPIIQGSDQYKDFDEIYSYYKHQGDDIQAFLNFVEEYVVL